MRELDRVELGALGASTALHLGLVLYALLGGALHAPAPSPAATAEPTPQSAPEPEQAQVEMRPVLEREAEASAAQAPPPPPPMAAELDPLELGPLVPEPRDHRQLAEQAGQGTGDASEGWQFAPVSSASDALVGLSDRLREEAGRTTEETGDLRRKEWQRTAFLFQLVNGLEQVYRERWRPRFGHLGPRTEILLDLEVASDGTVRYHGIVAGHGTGIAELDRAIDTHLRHKPPTLVRPTREHRGRCPHKIRLE